MLPLLWTWPDSWVCGTGPTPSQQQRISRYLRAFGYRSQDALLRNCALSPAQFCAAAAWIGAKFFCSGAHDFVGDLGVRAGALPSLERFFNAAIFARMKREDGDSPPRLEA